MARDAKMDELRRILTGCNAVDMIADVLHGRVEKYRADLEKARNMDEVARAQGGIAALRKLADDIQGKNIIEPESRGGYF
ncbi:MAG: hypothetical protein LBP61_08245 [Desulfovibrio sp.]|jgi:hypothetical protein|nr:hypothetical protein [Desulfovibrio sp.]